MSGVCDGRGGLRWADDLGSQDYNSLNQGIKLWGKRGTPSAGIFFKPGPPVTTCSNRRPAATRRRSCANHARQEWPGPSWTEGDLRRPARQRAAALGDRPIAPCGCRTRSPLDRPARIRWAMVARADVKIRARARRSRKAADALVSRPRTRQCDARHLPDGSPPPTDARNEGTRDRLKSPAGKRSVSSCNSCPPMRPLPTRPSHRSPIGDASQ
jgi:hypothetical protein